MEKEKIFSTLKEKLGTTSLSDRTINDYVENVKPAEGIEPDDVFFNAHVNILRSLGGQYSHDVATQVEDFKKNYKPVDTKTDPKTDTISSEVKAELDALKAKQKELDELLASQKRERENTALYKEVIGKAKELVVANENIWEDSVKSVTIEENMTSEQLLTKAKSVYEANLKRYCGGDASPYSSTGGSGGDTAKALDDFFARKASEGKFPTQENK